MTPTGPQFELDRFQKEALAHIDRGSSVMVAAPTGSGKTLVAEHAIDRALSNGKRAFYTAPIKALSNQKFNDLSQRIGSRRVGLLTGDNTINGDADVVVMTTEVLRNMLYEGRNLDDLEVVVLDEVHYLEDVHRGPVWEEVILNLPLHVSLICLSATVSNADEVRGWLEAVRGDTELVVETTRPVDLINLYVVGDRESDRPRVVPTLVDGQANPDGRRFDPDLRRGRDKRGPRRRRWMTPNRNDVIDLLKRRDLLPTIWFVFSRKGCDEAAEALARGGTSFTSPEEAAEIRRIAEERIASLDEDDLRLLGAEAWMRRLEQGIASHHAGLVPAFKETIELCFAKGLVRVVFATETLALGVNLPARSVVLDQLSKFTGETHEILTPAQFTQITGRAGRRGIDEVGHALVPWSPFVTFDQVASLAASRSFSLRSAFRPTYNMAINLLSHHTPDEARALLARSFAQYQSNRELVRLDARLSHQADVGTPTVESPSLNEALKRLRPGDIVIDSDGGRLALLGVSWRKGGRARIRLVSARAHDVRWDSTEIDTIPITVGHIDLPTPHTPDQIGFRTEVANRIKRVRVDSSARALRRRQQRPKGTESESRPSQKEVKRIKRLADRHRDSIPQQFDAICDVLHQRDHLDDWRVTDSGRILSRVYHDLDLLITDSVIAGAFDDLTSSELASVVSTLTFEHRRAGPAPDPWFPSRNARRSFLEITRISERLNQIQHQAGLTPSRKPEPGFAAMAHSWAAGEDLAVLLGADEDLTPGDFVRNIKQLTDLLRQLASISPSGSTRSAAAAAVVAIQRGVVAASGAIEGHEE